MDEEQPKYVRIDFFFARVTGASFATAVILGGLAGLICSLKGWHFWTSFGVGLIGIMAINALMIVFLKSPDQEIKQRETIVRSTAGHLLGYTVTFSILYGLVYLVQIIFGP